MQPNRFALLAMAALVLVALNSTVQAYYDDDDDDGKCAYIGYKLADMPDAMERELILTDRAAECKRCCTLVAKKENAYFHLEERRECRCTNAYTVSLYEDFA